MVSGAMNAKVMRWMPMSYANAKQKMRKHKSISPHLPIPFTQSAIHIHGCSTRCLTSPLRTTIRLQHLNSTPQQLLDFVLPPLLLRFLYLIHNLPHPLFFISMLVRLPIPPLLQLVCRRLLQPTLDVRVLLEDLEVILVGGKEGRQQRLGAEFEDDECEKDDDETEPPCQTCAEATQEGVAHIVDFGVWIVGAGEDDVPKEPAAD